MGIVRTAIGVTPYAVTVTAGQHKFVADEPADHLGRRHILLGAELLEHRLLAGVDKDRESCGAFLDWH